MVELDDDAVICVDGVERGVPLILKLEVTMREPVRELDGKEPREGVLEGVQETPVEVAVVERVLVTDGVGEGVGNITPATYSGPAYIVPALVTEFQAFVVKVPAVAPVHTLVRERMP